MHAHLADKPHTGPTPFDDNPLAEIPEEVFIDDLDAELEALFAEGLTFERRPNRAQRRKAAKSVTRYETSWQGRRLRWGPTQVPAPLRISVGRRRAKAARASRKVNR